MPDLNILTSYRSAADAHFVPDSVQVLDKDEKQPMLPVLL